MNDPAPAAPAPPAWASWSARVVRHLPMARYRAMNWISQRPPPAFVARLPDSSMGLRFECDLRNALAREVFFTGRYEPQETALIRPMLAVGATFVDVGAHWGYFSLIAAECVGPTGSVVSVEADPRIYRILERNRALNALENVHVVHAAAAAEPGTLTLAGYDEGLENWGLSRVLGAGASTAGVTYEVRARPMDALLDELGIGAVDLIKIDIEGAEALALRGMSDGLRDRRYRRILLELHPADLREHGTDAGAVVRSLLDEGYRGWTVEHSAAAVRRAAYNARLSPDGFLRPFDVGDALDAWPHMVFAAPDVPLFRDRDPEPNPKRP